MPFVYHDLNDALRDGFQVYDKTTDGYLVRRRGASGLWEMAVVIVKEHAHA